ncbi:MAG TPA: hypothetical protein PKW24_05710 [Clostridiales bacterium]|jgi:hypothetical protein|nr:hypothetical protein [Clostridiales bacterium]
MSKESKNIKYTAVLPEEQVKELKELAALDYISSVNSGIRLALESFITKSKNELYQKQMEAAAKDEGFMKRTLDTQEAFSASDQEVGGEW